MSIDYAGLFACPVRQQVSQEDLLAMEKARARGQAALQAMRADPGVNAGKPESEWTYIVALAGPDGVQERRVRVADMLAQAQPLDALAPHCNGCPHNVRADAFGCGGAIHYPLSEAAEHWLLTRLPDDLDTQRGRLLLQALADFAYDGSPVDAARHRRDLYDSAVPVLRRWGGWLRRKTAITSSQLLHMAFAVGPLQAAHAKLVAYFLGYLDDQFQPTTHPDNHPTEGDDDTVAELKLFALVAARAGTQGVRVYVDA